MNIKKVLLLSSSIFIGASLVIVPSVLYFTTGKITPIYESKKYLIRSNSKLNIDGYFFDTSATYGTIPTKNLRGILGANLLRVETTGETSFIADNNNLEVEESSKERLVLELAKEIIFEYKLKTDDASSPIRIRVFDNDKAEINPNDSKVGGKTPIVTLSSKDPNSINSPEFRKFLYSKENENNEEIEIINISFTVKDDKYWVDQNGNKTKYKIQVEDFWYSYMRTKLFDFNFRNNNGGSKELDKFFIDKSKTASRFSEKDRYPNEYLFEIFGLDAKALLDKTKSIRTIKINDEDKRVISFYGINNFNGSQGYSAVDWSKLFDKMFFNSSLFLAAPSAYIDEELAKNDSKNNTSAGKIEGAAREFGIYTYAMSRSETLFASSYVPIQASDNRIRFIKNNYFANDEFLKLDNNLNEIILEYTVGIDQSTFRDQIFNNFLNKTISEIEYNHLNNSQKQQIWGQDGSDYKKNGLLFTKNENKSSLVQRTLLVTNPAPCNDPSHFNNDGSHKNGISHNGLYNFNDQYAKFVFGSSIEDLALGKAETASSFFANNGFKLRTYLNASINWFTFINNIFDGNKYMWLNHAAPHARYSQNYDDSDDKKIPLLDYEIVNSVGYLDENNNVVNITPSDMAKHNVENPGDNEKLQSPKYKEISELVQKLLDSNPEITSNNPLTWSIIYPQSDNDNFKINQLEKLINIIKGLDPKGRLNPNVKAPKDRDEMLKLINNNYSIQDFQGWSYDYEGIGSYLDGISHGDGISLLGAFGIFSKLENNSSLANNFPNFTFLSKELDKFAKQNWIFYKDEKLEDLKVENWEKLTNRINTNINGYFSSRAKEVGGVFDMSTEIAKFFIYFESLVKPPSQDSKINFPNLVRELNMIAGFSMEAELSIDDPNSAGYSLVLDKYLYPSTNKEVLYLQDIRVDLETKGKE
ncbi:MAG: OppA family ABC transporter substrate-binding lipoprotein [Metamycoplasmataceae bacterium]